MEGNTVVAQLRQAAFESVSRGFSILICEPHDKNPWPKYSPHAVNSATRDAAIAYKAWDDGHEANYGVAGGQSNLTIIDVDKGIANYAQLKDWMQANGLPETFTVQSGRDTSFGAHLYYSGAVNTTPYEIQGVIGELRGIGAYVVGPGSIHPSGKKYTILNDIPPAPLPEHMQNLAAAKKKSMADFKPVKGNLIPEGNRWAHLQSKAGKLKQEGITDEDVLYACLKNFAENFCENGADYPDHKIRQLAEWAATDECQAGEPEGIITCGSPDPEDDSVTAEMPLEVIEGDYLGDLAGGITAGTFIPPSFARADLKTILGSVLDGKIAFPGEDTIHTRHWTAVISSRPGAGKSVCWDRCISYINLPSNGKDGLLKRYSIEFPPAGFFSSGEHAIKTLAENDGKSHILYFDEMKTLFEKGNNNGSTLFPKLLELYEQKSAAVGSLTHNTSKFDNVSLSMAGNFTRAGFDRAVSGKGAGGDGFLSRMVLDYSSGIDYQGDWADVDTPKVNATVLKINEAVDWLSNYVAEHEGKPFIPVETETAKHRRKEFQKWLSAEKTRIQEQHPDASYAARLEAHFKRDLLLRVAFTPEREITETLVNKSWAWAKHQLMLCEELWPIDMGGAIEKFEKRIINAIEKKGPLTKAGVQKFSNADRGEGGFEAWNRAWKNLLAAEKVIMLRIKSNRGKEKFGFDNATWSKGKEKWIFGSV